MPSNRPSRQPLPGLAPQIKLPAAPLTSKPKGTVPLKTGPTAAPTTKTGTGQPFMSKLDMSAWDRDPDAIFELLYNKEPPIDEHRGTV
jgi:hypothetical protein